MHSAFSTGVMLGYRDQVSGSTRCETTSMSSKRLDTETTLAEKRNQYHTTPKSLTDQAGSKPTTRGSPEITPKAKNEEVLTDASTNLKN